jgi:putative transposase
MISQRLSNGARFQWRGASYQITRLLPAGQVNLEDLLTGTTSTVEMMTLVQALFNDELHFLVDNKPRSSATTPPAIRPPAALALSEYPTELVAIARYRLAVIEPLLKLENRTRTDVRQRVQSIKAEQSSDREPSLYTAVSVAAVYRWLGDYVRSGFDLRALIPAVQTRGGNGQLRLPGEVNALIDIILNDLGQVQEKITVDTIRQELAVRLAEENRLRPTTAQLRLPARDTIAQRLRNSAVQAKPRTSRTARSAQQVGQTPYPDIPLERVEIDHTRADLIVIDDRDNLPLGRLTLTYCLDTATRYPLGYYLGFEPPSYLTVMECLHHAILPKGDVRDLYGTEHTWQAYGVPATLVIDNGKEFIGRDLEDACCLLGTVLQYTPVLTPQFKAGIERMFGSMNTLLFHTLPGTTFSNLAERGAYDSAKQACVYLSEVDKLMHLFVVDIYAERFHRGLNGIPARCWEEKTSQGFAPALPPSGQELAILLSRTDTRVIHSYGLEFSSLRYNAEELLTLRTRLNGQAAKIKYHPADLSALYVYDPFEQQYLRVPALDQEYTQGLSLWKHRVIRQAVLDEQARVDPVALGQAKRKIQAIVEEGRQRRQQGSRTRAARWEMAGQSTRALAQLESSTPPEVPVHPEAASEVLPLSLTDAQSCEPSDHDGWEVSYVPLKSLPAPVLPMSPAAGGGGPKCDTPGQGVTAEGTEVQHG